MVMQIQLRVIIANPRTRRTQ